ncbi:hypothetical protein FOL47_009120 [Perkinsus chesapeaki]|uniref:Uncharacterized protein n=1 Tax=Perkinsus chesapeaki TaxID=330153 RepID=A0A7J6LAB6_PERCH|nr:hypothetical protein FOL47_009120 [Perkinsus chesapeaki]
MNYHQAIILALAIAASIMDSMASSSSSFGDNDHGHMSKMNNKGDGGISSSRLLKLNDETRMTSRAAAAAAVNNSLIELNNEMMRSQEKQKKRILPLIAVGIAAAAVASQAKSKKIEEKEIKETEKKYESTGDQTLDEMMKWIDEVMKEYSKDAGLREEIDKVIDTKNSDSVGRTGGIEFSNAKRAEDRLKDNFPRYIKAVLNYVNQTEIFYDNAKSLINKIQTLVLPRSSQGLMKLRRKLGESVVKETAAVKKAFSHIFDELKDIEESTGKEIGKATKESNIQIDRAIKDSMREVAQQSAQLTRLCYTTDREIKNKFRKLNRDTAREQKKLVRSVDRMERDFKGDENDFERYVERFSEETGKGEAKIEKVTRGMNDRAERAENEVTLHSSDYASKGEMRINQTLPKAIRSTDRLVDSAIKSFEKDIDRDSRDSSRNVKLLDREVNRKIKDTERNATKTENDAKIMFDAALRGFNNGIKDLTRGNTKHNMDINKQMRDADKNVEMIEDTITRDKKDAEELLEKLDTSLEQSVASEMQTIEASTSNEKTTLSRRAEMINSDLAQIATQSKQASARAADSYTQLTSTLEANHDKDLEHEKEVIDLAEGTIDNAQNDISNEIKSKVALKERLQSNSEAAMRGMVNSAELEYQGDVTKAKQDVNNMKDRLEARSDADSKINNADVKSIEDESKGELDRILESEGSVHVAAEGLPDVQTAVSGASEGAKNILNEIKKLGNEMRSSLNPLNKEEDKMKSAVRVLEALSAGQLQSIQGIDGDDVSKAKATLHELITTFETSMDTKLKNDLAKLAGDYGVSMGRIKEMFAGLDVSEENQRAMTGRMHDNVADVESDEKNAKASFGKKMTSLLSHDKLMADHEFHEEMRQLREAEIETKKVMLKLVFDVTTTLLSGGKENEVKISNSIKNLLMLLDKLHAEDLQENTAVADARSKYKSILPRSDREIEAIQKQLDNEKLRIKTELDALEIFIKNTAFDRSRIANNTMNKIDSEVDGLSKEVTKSRDVIMSMAKAGSDHISKFIVDLRDALARDARLDKTLFNDELKDMKNKYSSLESFTDERAKAIISDMEKFGESANYRQETLAETLARVVTEAESMGLSEEEMQEYVKKKLSEESGVTSEEFDKIKDMVNGDLVGFRDKVNAMKKKAEDELFAEDSHISSSDGIQNGRLADYAQMIESQALKGGNVIGYNAIASEKSYKTLEGQESISGNELLAMMHIAEANSGSLIDHIAESHNVSTDRVASVDDAVTTYMVLIKDFMDEMQAEMDSLRGRLNDLQGEYDEKITQNTNEYMKPAIRAAAATIQFENFQRESEPLQKAFRTKATEMMANVRKRSHDSERIANVLSRQIEKGAALVESTRQKLLSALERHSGEKEALFAEELLHLTKEEAQPALMIAT